MKKTVLRYNLSVLILYCAFTIQAQPPLHYLEQLTTADGLSSNVITDVVQDENGFLWIGTENGLNRYDGAEVEQYFAGNDSISLTDNTIHRLIRWDTFHIAIATDHGLSILDTRDYTFVNMFFHFDSILDSYYNRILYMEKDHNGNLWLGTPVSVYRLDSKLHIEKVYQSTYTKDDIGKIRFHYTYRIIPTATGEVMIWLNGELHIWDPLTDSLFKAQTLPLNKWSAFAGSSYFDITQVYGHYLIKYNSDKKLKVWDELSGEVDSCTIFYNSSNRASLINNISQLDKGWLALSLDSKGLNLVRILNQNGRLHSYCSNKLYYPDKKFGKVICDSEDNWWFPTKGNGLMKISAPKQLFSEKILKDKFTHKPSPYEISSFFQLNNDLFIGSYGDGFYRWNRLSGKLKQQSVKHGRHLGNKVWNFSLHSKDTLWIGTQHGLLYYCIKNGGIGRIPQPHPLVLDSFAITTQFIDSKDLVWMGIGFGNGVCIYDKVTQKFHVYPNADSAYPYRYPYKIAEDKNSDLWFISDASAHLVKWDRGQNQFMKVIIPQFKGKSNIYSGTLYLDCKDNLIWYGAENAGLVRYDISTCSVKIYSLEDGLNSDKIYSIVGDLNGILWIATNLGITSFNPRTEHFRNYSTKDGLPDTHFSARMYYDSILHILYAGAPGKLIYFSPEKFTMNRPLLHARITSIKVNNKALKIPNDREIQLNHSENDLYFSFTAVNLTDGRNNRYSYKLGGIDSMWKDIGAKREIRFASLEPGHYRFIVRTAARDGKWSPFADRVNFTISPPFVKTIWFYILTLFLISCAIYGWYRYRLSNILHLEKMRSRISHDLHDDIGSRLTNINLIAQLVRQKEQKKEQKEEWLTLIQDESLAISRSMQEIVWNINPDNDSLENAMPQMLRYAYELLENKKIKVHGTIEGLNAIKMNMEERRDLFLIFKEAIHNIVKHSTATETLISMNKNNRIFSMRIEDNGIGFLQDTLRYKNGLTNMQARAIRHDWQLEIKSEKGYGTRLNLNIKIT